jgi:hypothetical protein
MEPYSIEQPVSLPQGDDLWRIHVDLDDSYKTFDGRPAFHHCDGVSREEAHRALSNYRSRYGEGIGFEQHDTGQLWFYPWFRVVGLRIMPMREAI